MPELTNTFELVDHLTHQNPDVFQNGAEIIVHPESHETELVIGDVFAQGKEGQIHYGYAPNIDHGQWIAVKEPHLLSLEYNQAIQLEAELMQEFSSQSKFFIRTFGSVLSENSGKHVLMMELLQGEGVVNLADRLQQIRQGDAEPFNLNQISTLAGCMKEQLQVMHRRDTPFIHADIKPDQLYWVTEPNGESYFVLGDATMGSQIQLLKQNPDELDVKYYVGTPNYAHPEFTHKATAPQLHEIDERSDQYGMAMVLYETITNQKFHQDTDRVNQPDPALTDSEAHSQKVTLLREAIIQLCAIPPDQLPDQLGLDIDRFVDQFYVTVNPTMAREVTAAQAEANADEYSELAILDTSPRSLRLFDTFMAIQESLLQYQRSGLIRSRRDRVYSLSA